MKNLTQAEASAIQATNFNHATQDLYQAIDRGDFPEWELRVQIMSDDEHAELGWDPLDPTKVWPEDRWPQAPVGKMVLNRNPSNVHAETEQVAFGTGVLVDGLDFSDDKLLQGRTFSYSDTQRYRVGSNYLQLPINRPQCPFASNQQGGQMAYAVDTEVAGSNPHINYEPSSRGGLQQQERTRGPAMAPRVSGTIGRAPISRPANFVQAGERYRAMEAWERDDLILNLTGALAGCNPDIQARMVAHFTAADPDYGRRVAEGLGIPVTA